MLDMFYDDGGVRDRPNNIDDPVLVDPQYEKFGEEDSPLNEGVDLDDISTAVPAYFHEMAEATKIMHVDMQREAERHRVRRGAPTNRQYEATMKNRWLFADFARQMQSAAKVAKQAKIKGNLDETERIDTSEDHYDLLLANDLDRLSVYGSTRNREVEALYQHLGVKAATTRVNCFGSYREVAIEAYKRESDWATTSVSAWLRKLEPVSQKWSGGDSNYSSLLVHLPGRVHSYLDYGAGSGRGAVQIYRYLGRPQNFEVYDIEDNMCADVRKEVCLKGTESGLYNLVTMVNVIHHVDELQYALTDAMSRVEEGGTLMIKDHFVNGANVILAVLLHEMYEPTTTLSSAEVLYFRPLKAVVDFIRMQGWVVDVRSVPKSDVGDTVLICRNLRMGGRAQIIDLEDKVLKLAEEVAELKVMLSAKFQNASYTDKKPTRREKGIGSGGNRVRDKDKVSPTGDVVGRSAKAVVTQTQQQWVEDKPRQNRRVRSINDPVVTTVMKPPAHYEIKVNVQANDSDNDNAGIRLDSAIFAKRVGNSTEYVRGRSYQRGVEEVSPVGGGFRVMAAETLVDEYKVVLPSNLFQ